MADKDSHTTTDHETIKRWVQDRDGRPATVAGTSESGEESGVLRVEFPNYGDNEDELRQIEWDEFFDKFEQEKLAFLYQNELADGNTSRFFKFVQR